jgi:hypothetical protein
MIDEVFPRSGDGFGPLKRRWRGLPDRPCAARAHEFGWRSATVASA